VIRSLVQSVEADARTFARDEIDLASPRILPAPLGFTARTGKTPAALFLCDEAAGGMRDAMSASKLAANGTPTYAEWRKKRRGLNLDAAGDYFTLAGFLEPGTASMLVGDVFVVDAHDAATRSVCGKFSTGAGAKILEARLANDDKLYVYIDDGAGHATNTAAIGGAAITFGDLYALVYQVDKASGTLRTRLHNLTTGVIGTAADVSIAAYGTLTGGTAAAFSVGWTNGLFWGNGFTHLGLFALTGTDAEGADTPLAVLAGLGLVA
jgi:hypothetical protein